MNVRELAALDMTNEELGILVRFLGLPDMYAIAYAIACGSELSVVANVAARHADVLAKYRQKQENCRASATKRWGKQKPLTGDAIASKAKPTPYISNTEILSKKKESTVSISVRGESFVATPELIAWAAAAAPHVNCQTETEAWRTYWQSAGWKRKGKLLENLVASWKNWVLRAEKYATERSRPLFGERRPAVTASQVGEASAPEGLDELRTWVDTRGGGEVSSQEFASYVAWIKREHDGELVSGDGSLHTYNAYLAAQGVS